MALPIRQLNSQVSYLADGVTTVWDFSFAGGYIDKAHVFAQWLNPATGVVTNIPLAPGAWVGPFQLSLTPPVANGMELTIYRDTPKDVPLVDFTDKANLTEASLDLNARQAIFVAAESSDGLAVAIDSVSEIVNYVESARLFSVAADGSADAAAASAVAAASSASASNNSAIASSGSAGAAALSAQAAQASADSIAGGPVASVAGLTGIVGATPLRAALNVVSRAGDSMTAQLDEAPGVTLATAATVNIGAAASNTVYLTGSVGVTSLGAGTHGMYRRLRATAAVTLTHSAALVLPGAVNMAMLAGDWAEFFHNGTAWVCVDAPFTASPATSDNSLRNAPTAFVQALVATGARAPVALTVTPTAGAFTSASATGYFRKVGRFVQYDIIVTITNNGTGSGGPVRVLMPWPSAVNAVCCGRENAIAGFMLQGLMGAGGDILSIFKYDGNYPASNGAVFHMSGWYEATT